MVPHRSTSLSHGTRFGNPERSLQIRIPNEKFNKTFVTKVFCAIFIFPILMPGEFVRVPIWKKQKWFTTFAQSS